MSGLSVGIGASTGTAWLADLITDDKARATATATSANFLGLGIGALVAGFLAEFTARPLELPFILYLASLVVVLALVCLAHETVSKRSTIWHELSLTPQLAVPRDIRTAFVVPAVAGFGAMALVGFYAALGPSILAEQLHVTSHLAAGGIFFELALVVWGCILATKHLPSRASMLSALGLMPPSVALLVIAQTLASMPLLIVATAVCGTAVALGYRGSLQVVNDIAPEGQRAHVVSAYFVCGFAGNALPVIGVGVIATMANPIIASIAFAALISVFAAVALALGVICGSLDEP